MGPENLVQQALLTGGRPKAEWAEDWKQLATGEAAAMIDLSAVNQAITALKQEAPQEAQGPFLAFAPLWEKGRRLFLAASIDEGLKVAARVDCATARDADTVQQTTQAALTLARNMLEEFAKQAVAAPNAGAAAALPLSDLAIEAIRQSKLEANGEQVKLEAQLDLDVAETAVSALTPAVLAARQAARRAQAMNNIKQIMLAMLNYHDVYGHYPPPTLLGPDGKTRHSWRVAILPFLTYEKLYAQYKLDEPWDSENNQKVLAQMPAFFHEPQADPLKFETSYFTFVGATTALGPKDGKGTKIPEITDGASNTIAIVETKRAVPWTKPEDIDYDADKPLPRLGGWYTGGFLTGFCDGSVRFLPDTLEQQKLRALITKAGGELITGL